MFGFVHNPHPTHTQAVWQYAPRYAPRWQYALFYIFSTFKTHYFTHFRLSKRTILQSNVWIY